MTPGKKLSTKNETRKHSKRESSRANQRWALVERILHWVRREYFPLGPCWDHGRKEDPVLFSGKERFLDRFLMKIKSVVLSRGVAFAIPWIKERRQIFIKWVSLDRGTPEEVSLRRSVRGTWGSHVVFAVQKYQDGNPEYTCVLRMVLTALASLRGFRLPVKIDTSPITSPPGSDLSFLEDLRGLVRSFLGTLGFSPNQISRNASRVAWREPHFSVKGGPAGPAMFS